MQSKAKASRANPIEVSFEKYEEMLCVLPPQNRGGGAFLVGEPYDHEGPGNAPRFQAYMQKGEQYFDIGLMDNQKFDDIFNLFTVDRLLKLNFFENKKPETRVRFPGTKDETTVKVWVGSAPGLERYWFDNKLKTRHGRFQADNQQDAPYYGERVNFGNGNSNRKPASISYVEGDIYLVEYLCEKDLAMDLKTNENFRGIDGGSSDARCSQVASFCKEYGILNYGRAND